MKNKIRNMALAVFSIIVVLSVSTVRAEEKEKEHLQKESQQALANFLKADSSLQKFLAGATGYAIFPSVGKGGLIVGGAHGKGLVYEKTNLIGHATMSQASIGPQIGGQSFAEIIFFETPVALNDFTSGKFEFNAEASAVAATEGASTAANYKNGAVVFTLPKEGLMLQASIGGQKFKYEPESLQPTGRSSSKD